MHSYWSRISQLTSVYIFALFVCGLWTYLGGKAQEFSSGAPALESVQAITNAAVTKYGTHPLTHADAAVLELDIFADLRPAFTWSTNALFAFVSVRYATAYRPRNEVVVWDKVFTNKSTAIVSLNKGKTKYLLQDYSRGHLMNNTIEATFHYYQMPKTGFFHRFKLGRPVALKMPESYTVKGRIRS